MYSLTSYYFENSEIVRYNIFKVNDFIRGFKMKVEVYKGITVILTFRIMNKHIITLIGKKLKRHFHGQKQVKSIWHMNVLINMWMKEKQIKLH